MEGSFSGRSQRGCSFAQTRAQKSQICQRGAALGLPLTWKGFHCPFEDAQKATSEHALASLVSMGGVRSRSECLNPSLWQRSLHELSSNSLFFICSSASLPLCILFPAYFASLCLSYAAGSWAGMLHGDTERCW